MLNLKVNQITMIRYLSKIGFPILLALCLLFLNQANHESIEVEAASSLQGSQYPGAFLYWPVPVGWRSITYLPDSAWTHNFLGITHCPPYPGLIDGDNGNGRAFWPYYHYGWHPVYRNVLLPNTTLARAKWQNRYRKRPGFGNVAACYSRSGNMPDHKGTDFSAYHGTAVYAAAWADQITVVRDYTGGYRVTLRHPNINGTGQTWYTVYDHLSSSWYGLGTSYPSDGIQQGARIGGVGAYHLHFEVAIGNSRNTRNPWGVDNPPWDGCLWLNQNMCVGW